MKLIRGLFFDLDGTLADNYQAQFRSYKRAAEAVGRTFDEKTYKPLHGMNYKVFLPKMYPDITTAEVEKISKLKTQYFADELKHIKPNHSLISFLKPLRDSHILVLVTSSKEISARRILSALGLDDVFHHMVFGEMTEKHKPHPEAYLKALELSGLEPDEVLAFEDSAHGIESAIAAGIRTVKISV